MSEIIKRRERRLGLAVRVPESVLAGLRDLSKEHGVRLTDLVEHILRAFLKKAEPNPKQGEKKK